MSIPAILHHHLRNISKPTILAMPDRFFARRTGDDGAFYEFPN